MPPLLEFKPRPAFQIPEWARNGGVAYCRWDGGPMEVAKANLSGWEFLTSPGAVCSVYDWYGDRGFQLVREAGFNWIWVTWSCGFAYESEEIQHRVLRPFIARCRQAGIRVTAYMSMCNAFHHDVAIKQPDLLACMQRDGEGDLVPYGGAKFKKEPERVLACLNHPQWRVHLKNRLKTALDAGADGAFYDNLAPWCMCERCRDRFRRYTRERLGYEIEMPQQHSLLSPVFAEVAAEPGEEVNTLHWQLLQTYQADLLNEVGVELTHYAESFSPEFMVYFNWHTYHQTFGAPELKALSTEDGVKCGYVGPDVKLDAYAGFDCDGYMTNAGLLRRMRATADEIRPLRIQSHKVTSSAYMEGRNFVPYDATDWKRLLAECWCFRAAQEVFLEGNFQTELYAGRSRAVEAWKAISDYNRFQAAHRDLWISAQRAEVAFGVLVLDNYPNPHKDWQRIRLLSVLSLEGYQFDVVLNDQLEIARIERYPLIWCPSAERLSEKELAELESYLKTGGKIVATGQLARFSSIGVARSEIEIAAWLKKLAAAGGENFQYDPSESDYQIGDEGRCESRVPAMVRKAQDRFSIRVEADEKPIIWTCWSTPEGARIIFVLNPDSRAPRRNIRIEVAKTESEKLEWITPDKSDAACTISREKNGLVCRIPSLNIFGFCLIQ